MKKYCLVTHTDLDGVGCAILAYKAFKDFDVHYCNYSEVNACVLDMINSGAYKQYETIFITDISINRETLELIIAQQIEDKFVLLDHHETADWLNEYSFAVVQENLDDKKTCGTELFYYYLLGLDLLIPCAQEVTFVEGVRSYDTWEWTSLGLSYPKNLNDLLGILGRDEFILWVCDTDGVLSNKEYDLLRVIQKQRQRYAAEKNKRIIPLTYNSYAGLAVFADSYVSEVGDYILNQNPFSHFVVIIDMSSRAMSFRTQSETCKVNEIAKSFGGGGHPKSAGAPLNQAFLERIISKMF